MSLSFRPDQADSQTPKNIKATRRLSTRFTSFVHKIGGKKDGSTTPPVEKSEAAATAPVSDEAPKLDQPALAEPLKMEEVSSIIRLRDIELS
jgi:hypothetical protein